MRRMATALLALALAGDTAFASTTPEDAKGIEGATQALSHFLAAAHERDVAEARGWMTSRTVEMIDAFSALAHELHATSIPENLMEVWLETFDRERPKVLRGEATGERARLTVRYQRGHLARLDFRHEGERWKLDLERSLSNSLEMLEEAGERWDAAKRGELVGDDDHD